MVALRQISEQRDFVVSSASLKDVRSFSREVFEKVNIEQDLKDELVRQTIMDTQEDVDQILEDLKKIDERLYEIRKNQ